VERETGYEPAKDTMSSDLDTLKTRLEAHA